MCNMKWIRPVGDVKRMVELCCEMEQIRSTVNYNLLLGQSRLSHLRVVKQLKRSRRAQEHDYFKGEAEIPCYGFVAGKTADNPAITFVVSFEQEPDGTVYLWIQEFHL